MSAKDHDLRVVGALALSAEVGVAKAAKLCKVSAATIHRAHQQLGDKQVIQRVCMIDWRRLGSWNINLFFGLPEKRRAITLAHLKKNPRVLWLAENLFSLRYEATVSCRDLYVLARVLDQVSGDSSGGLLDARWAWELTYTAWPLKIYPIGQERYRELPGSYEPPSLKLDELDFLILDELRHTFDNYSIVARSLKIPSSTLHARIERMRKAGVIRGVFYYANWSYLGLAEFQIVLSGCERGAKMVKDLKAFCRESHNLVEFYECVGSFDFKIWGVANDERQALDILDELKDTFGDRISEASLIRRNKLLDRKMIKYEHLYGDDLS